MRKSYFGIRILTAVLSSALLLGAAAAAPPESALLQDIQNLAYQNAELSENIPELEAWYQRQETEAQEQFSKNLQEYENRCKKYAAEKTHKWGSPVYQQTSVEMLPMASGFYQDVLFEVVDEKGEPVEGAFLMFKSMGKDPLGDELKYSMDLFADRKGQALYRLQEGSYRLGCMRQEQTVAFTVKKQTTPQKVQFPWKGKTPIQQRAELADRMEVHITDPQGKPVPNVEVWFRDWNPYGPTPSMAIISEIIYTDKTGSCVLEAPYYEIRELTMRLTDEDGNNYQQSERVIVPKRTGVSEVYVCWKPERWEPEEDNSDQEPIPSQYREIKMDFSYLNSMTRPQLQAEYQKRKKENDRLRQAIGQVREKLVSLEQSIRQKEEAEISRLEKQYGIA